MRPRSQRCPRYEFQARDLRISGPESFRDLIAYPLSDQYAVGQVVVVVHRQHASTDPIAALDTWLRHRGTEPGRLFTSRRTGSVTSDPISGEAISIVLRKRARAAGLAAERITAHSLRAGHATSAAVAGVALDRIAAQTRHKRLSTLIERYIRPAQAMEYTSSRDLGL